MKYAALCSLVFPALFLAAGLAAGVVGVCLVWMVIHPLVLAFLLQATRPWTGSLSRWRSTLPSGRPCSMQRR